MKLLEKWPHRRLGDICLKIGSGSTPRGGDSVYQTDGAAIIRSQNVYNGVFNFDGLARLSNEHAEQLNSVTVEAGDVLLNITGDSVARCCQAPESVIPARVNQHVAIIRPDRTELNPRFLCYYLISPLMQSYLVSIAGSGGTRKALTKGMVEEFEVPCPSMPIQDRLVEILSAYDDLIENNRRRMALLDESARLLYQEWFVRLHFPGHEHIRIVNGLPDGWERRTLGDCLTLKRGHDLPEANRVPGTIPIVSSSGITGFHNVKKASGPGLVTGRYGTLGEVYYVDEDYWPHNTALYVCDFKGNSARVLYFFLKHALQSAQSNNAAVPGLNRNVLHTLRVLWPPANLRDHFDVFLEYSFRQLASLRRFNERLATARDLLLPRLMSGEVLV